MIETTKDGKSIPGGPSIDASRMISPPGVHHAISVSLPRRSSNRRSISRRGMRSCSRIQLDGDGEDPDGPPPPRPANVNKPPPVPPRSSSTKPTNTCRRAGADGPRRGGPVTPADPTGLPSLEPVPVATTGRATRWRGNRRRPWSLGTGSVSLVTEVGPDAPHFAPIFPGRSDRSTGGTGGPRAGSGLGPQPTGGRMATALAHWWPQGHQCHLLLAEPPPKSARGGWAPLTVPGDRPGWWAGPPDEDSPESRTRNLDGWSGMQEG